MSIIVGVSLHIFMFAFAVCMTLFLIFVGNLFTKSGTKMAYVASVAMKTFAVIMFLSYFMVHCFCIKDLYFSHRHVNKQPKKVKIEKLQHNYKKNIKKGRKQ